MSFVYTRAQWLAVLTLFITPAFSFAQSSITVSNFDTTGASAEFDLTITGAGPVTFTLNAQALDWCKPGGEFGTVATPTTPDLGIPNNDGVTAASVVITGPVTTRCDVDPNVTTWPGATATVNGVTKPLIAVGAAFVADFSGTVPTPAVPPPVISGTPPSTVAAGSLYTFTPAASDPQGRALTFSIQNRPGWASFSKATGRLRGTPGTTNLRTYRNITIAVSNGLKTAQLAPFSIAVTAPAGNSAPVISGVPPASVTAGSAYAFVPTASDADNNPLTFSVSGLPAWATFDTQTGRLAGTPPAGTTGVFANIVISVSDGVASAALPAFSITVNALPATNTPPTISGVPSTTGTVGTLYAFTPSASDANGDTLTFSIANRPTWASFNANTGTLQGTPSIAGTYGSIVISVSDGRTSTPLPTFTITVNPKPNTPPTISGVPSTTGAVGAPYAFTPSASDANGDTLTFSIANKPNWASFSASTGTLQGTPSIAGTYGSIIISVSDGQASTPLPTFTITVSSKPNTAPTISGVPPTSVMPGTQYAFQPTAADADGDVLTFSIANKPAWATFTTSTGRLQGTPGAVDVGTTSGIVITVTDGKTSTALPAFNLTVLASATGSATLSWQPPTQNTDGTPLTNLAGYKVRWGASQGTYPNSVTLNNPGLATYIVGNLAPGTYYFVVTAFNATGAESSWSNSTSKTIP